MTRSSKQRKLNAALALVVRAADTDRSSEKSSESDEPRAKHGTVGPPQNQPLALVAPEGVAAEVGATIVPRPTPQSVTDAIAAALHPLFERMDHIERRCREESDGASAQTQNAPGGATQTAMVAALQTNAALVQTNAALTQQVAALSAQLSLVQSRVGGACPRCAPVHACACMQTAASGPAPRRASYAATARAPRAQPATAAPSVETALPPAAGTPVVPTTAAAGQPTAAGPAAKAARMRARHRGRSVSSTRQNHCFKLLIPTSAAVQLLRADNAPRRCAGNPLGLVPPRWHAKYPDHVFPAHLQAHRLAVAAIRSLGCMHFYSGNMDFYWGSGDEHEWLGYEYCPREVGPDDVVTASFLNAVTADSSLGVKPRGGTVLVVEFTVATDHIADFIVRERCQLKTASWTGGAAVSIFEVLTDHEEKQRVALWPTFLAAKAEGKKAQFSRARLRINGVQVAAPV